MNIVIEEKSEIIAQFTDSKRTKSELLDPFASKVSCSLRCESNVNNNNLVIDEVKEQVTVNAVTNRKNSGKYRESLYFPSGAYIQYDYSPVSLFDLNTSDFTIELWIKVRALFTPMAICTLPSSYQFLIDYKKIRFLFWTPTPTLTEFFVNYTLDLDEWNHLALTREGNTHRIWVNGIEMGSLTSALRPARYDNKFRIGSYGSYPLDAEIEDFRFTKACRYSENFTPPGKISRIACDEAQFFREDSVLKSRLTYSGYVEYLVDSGPGGKSCFYFPDDNNGNFINFLNPDAAFTTGDFTIEFEFYLNSYPTSGNYMQLLAKREDVSYCPILIQIQGTDKKIYVWTSNTGTAWLPEIISDSVTPLNQWIRCAFVRSGDLFSLFVNGVKQAIVKTFSGNLFANTAHWYIGNTKNNSQALKGYIRDLRFSSTAHYTVNYTPIDTLPREPSKISSDVTIQTKRVGIKPGNLGMAFYNNYPNDPLSSFVNIANDKFIEVWDENFIFEAWMYFNSTPSNDIVSTRRDSSNYCSFYLGITGGKLQLLISGPDNNWNVNFQAVTSISNNVWNHIAFGRKGNTFYILQNGKLEATSTLDIKLKSYNPASGGLLIWLEDMMVEGIYFRKGYFPPEYTKSTYTIPTTHRLDTNTNLFYENANKVFDLTQTTYFDFHTAFDKNSNYQVQLINDATLDPVALIPVNQDTNGTLLLPNFNSSGVIQGLDFSGRNLSVMFFIKTAQSDAHLLEKVGLFLIELVAGKIVIHFSGNDYFYDVIINDNEIHSIGVQFTNDAILYLDGTMQARYEIYENDISNLNLELIRSTCDFDSLMISFDFNSLKGSTATHCMVYGTPELRDFSKFPGQKSFALNGSSYISVIDKLFLSSYDIYAKGCYDFTIECWVNIASDYKVVSEYAPYNANSRMIIFSHGFPGGSGGNGSWNFRQGIILGITNEQIILNIGNLSIDGSTGYYSVKTTAKIPFGTWIHVTLMIDNHIPKIFLNGVRQNLENDPLYSNTDVMRCKFYHSYQMNIGSVCRYFDGVDLESSAGSLISMNSFLDDFNLYKSLKYTNTNSEDIYSSNTVLQLPLTGDWIQDTSPLTKNVVNTGVIQSTIQSKFSAESAYFNGVDSFLEITSSDLNLAAGNFTIECWIFETERNNSNPVLFSSGTTFSSGALSFNLGSNWSLSAFDKGAPYTVAESTTNTPAMNSWHHLVLTRSGTDFKIFIDGAEVSAGTFSGNINLSSLIIGKNKWGGINSQFKGHLNDFRITKGIVRYTSNFTSSEFPTAISAQNFQTPGAQNNQRVHDSLANAQFIASSNNFIRPGKIKFLQKSLEFKGLNSIEFNGSCLKSESTFDGWFSLRTIHDQIIFRQDTTRIEIKSGKWSLINDSQEWNSTDSAEPELWYYIKLLNNGTRVRFYVNDILIIDSHSFVTPAAVHSIIGESFIGYAHFIRSFDYETTSTGIPVESDYIDDRYHDNIILNLIADPIEDPSVVLNLRCEDQVGTVVRRDDLNRQIESYGSAHLSAAETLFGTTTSLSLNAVSGDYLKVNYPPQFTNFTNFTFEFWIRFKVINGTVRGIIDQRRSVANHGFVITCNADNKIYCSVGDSSTTSFEVNIPSLSAVVANQWYHVAFTKQSSVWRFFLDGVKQGEVTWSGTAYDSNYPIFIGCMMNLTGFLDGYVDDLRISDSARYITNFDVPTASIPAMTKKVSRDLREDPDPGIIDSDVVLNMRCEGNHGSSIFIDDCGHNIQWINASGDHAAPMINKHEFKYSSSIAFNNYKYTLQGSDLGTVLNSTVGNVFTIECWCFIKKQPELTPDAYTEKRSDIFSQTSNAYSYNNRLTYRADRKFEFIRSSNLIGAISLVSSSTFRIETWHHIALVSNGSTWKLFINGILEASVSNSTSWYQGTYKFVIGAQSDVTYYNYGGFLHGYIEDIRITKRARYSENFTPPGKIPRIRVAGTHEWFLRGDVKSSGELISTGSSGANYLEMPINSKYTAFHTDFTIEGWFNPSVSGNDRYFFTQGYSSPRGIGLAVSKTQINFRICNINTIATVNITEESHIAFVRAGWSIRIYLNGVLVASGTSGCIWNYQLSTKFGAGDEITTDTNRYYGTISDFKMTDGIARHTNNFTPPQKNRRKFKTTDATFFLSENAFEIGSGTINASVNRNNSIEKRSGSLYNDGLISALRFKNCLSKTGTFECKLWLYSYNTTDIHYSGENYWSLREIILWHVYFNNVNDRISFGITQNKLFFRFSNTVIYSTSEVDLMRWHHMAFTIQDKTVNLFLNGKLESSMTLPSNLSQYQSLYSTQMFGFYMNSSYKEAKGFINGSVNDILLTEEIKYTGDFIPDLIPDKTFSEFKFTDSGINDLIIGPFNGSVDELMFSDALQLNEMGMSIINSTSKELPQIPEIRNIKISQKINKYSEYNEYFGDGRLYGSVTNKNGPMIRKITLLEYGSKRIVDSCWSDSNGYYEFINIRKDLLYTIIVEDDLDYHYNDVIRAKVRPE